MAKNGFDQTGFYCKLGSVKLSLFKNWGIAVGAIALFLSFQAAAEDAAYERTLIDAQRKREQKKFKATKQYDGFFVPAPEETNPVSLPSTNTSETK